MAANHASNEYCTCVDEGMLVHRTTYIPTATTVSGHRGSLLPGYSPEASPETSRLLLAKLWLRSDNCVHNTPTVSSARYAYYNNHLLIAII